MSISLSPTLPTACSRRAINASRSSRPRGPAARPSRISNLPSCGEEAANVTSESRSAICRFELSETLATTAATRRSAAAAYALQKQSSAEVKY
jgi:hypothetical protein